MHVRMSIGNLVPRAQDAETGQEFFFGIFYRKALTKGHRKLIALGGAAHMTDSGRRLLEDRYHAEMTNGLDARFIVEVRHQAEILELFQRHDQDFYEVEALRETIEEFTEESLPPIMETPPFTKEEITGIRVTYTKTAIQKPGAGKSLNEIIGLPTVRLFNLFTLTAPTSFITKLQHSPAFRIITPEQMNRTAAGQVIHTDDGIEIGDNIIW